MYTNKLFRTICITINFFIDNIALMYIDHKTAKALGKHNDNKCKYWF